MKSRGLRRKNNATKAIRKATIAGWFGFNSLPLHYYSKGKLHCSCPLCSAKTNGHAIAYGSLGRHGNNWAISDLKKLERMEEKMREYIVEIN